MQGNPPQAPPQSKDYIPRKEYNYNQQQRDFNQDSAPENQILTSGQKQLNNFPTAPKSQPSLIDSRNSSEQAYLTPSGEPIQVKQPQDQKQHHPQPIINFQTMLALDYLQTHLIGDKGSAVSNQTQAPNVPPSNNFQQQTQIDPNIQQYSRGNRENYYNDSPQQRGRNDYGNRGYNNKRDTDFRGGNAQRPNDFDKRRRNPNYFHEGDDYIKSRSRSNEKHGTFDRRQNYNNYPKDSGHGRYKDRDDYDKRIDKDMYQKQKNDHFEDWKCLTCGNVNWARRENCNKCGINKPENAPLVVNVTKDVNPKILPQVDRKVEKPYINDGYSKNQYHHGDGGVRIDYRSMDAGSNIVARPNYGNIGYKP